MKDFNIERIAQPNAEAYKQWKFGEVTVQRHFPRGTLTPKSLGEGYRINVFAPVFEDFLATTFAGFLQNNYQEGEKKFDYGVGIVRPNGPRLPNMHIFRCPKGADPIKIGITDAYVLEGVAEDTKTFLAQARAGQIELLLHEGAHPHRGDLPKFIHWLESVKAIPRPGF